MGPIDTEFVGRSRALGTLRSMLDRPEAMILRVEGMRGIGKSSLVRRALDSFDAATLAVPALPEPLQRAALQGLLSASPPDAAPTPNTAPMPDAVSLPPDWAGLFSLASARARPGRPPFVLILDDVHRLHEARARYLEPLHQSIREARAARRPFHVVLVGSRTEAPDDPDGLYAEPVVLGPLPLRPAARLLPGNSAEDRLRAYAVFGGIPRVLRLVDRSLTLETNIRKLLLEPDAPLADVAGAWLERDLQTPSRYNAILLALALGAHDWAELHRGVPDLTSSGQLAPYVRKLEELGLVSVRRSLDAREGSRARRYVLTDPFLSFWYRFVFGGRTGPMSAPATGRGAPSAVDVRLRVVRKGLDAHLEAVFPKLCRQHMRHDAMETLGANAREIGSLWGPGHDVPVAGILTSGAAFYGACSWAPPLRADDPLGALDAAARETRYGFGRQHRLRLLFTRSEPPRWLERDAARREQFLLIDARALVGNEKA